MNAMSRRVLQSDERVPTVRIVVAGSASENNSDFAVTRYWRQPAVGRSLRAFGFACAGA